MQNIQDNDKEVRSANELWKYCCDEIDKIIKLQAKKPQNEQIESVEKELEELHVRVQIKEVDFCKKYPVVVWMMIFNNGYSPKAFKKYLEKAQIAKKVGANTENEIMAKYPVLLYKQQVPKTMQNPKEMQKIYSNYVSELDRRDYDIETATSIAKERWTIQNKASFNERSTEVMELLKNNEFTDDDREIIARIYIQAKERHKTWQIEFDKITQWYKENNRVPDIRNKDELWIYEWIIKHKKQLDNESLEDWQKDQLKEFELWELALQQFAKVQEELAKQKKENQNKHQEELIKEEISEEINNKKHEKKYTKKHKPTNEEDKNFIEKENLKTENLFNELNAQYKESLNTKKNKQ